MRLITPPRRHSTRATQPLCPDRARALFPRRAWPSSHDLVRVLARDPDRVKVLQRPSRDTSWPCGPVHRQLGRRVLGRACSPHLRHRQRRPVDDQATDLKQL